MDEHRLLLRGWIKYRHGGGDVMIIRREQSQIKRLKDLMSEVQENHTRIQRLWKQVGDAELVWPVGIAAAPPIEEESSCDESRCFGCGDLPPSDLSLTVSLSGTVTDQPLYSAWIGTNNCSYLGFYTFSPDFKCHVWKSDSCISYDQDTGPGVTTRYSRALLMCRVCVDWDFFVVLDGGYTSSGSCSSASPSLIPSSFGQQDYSCDPMYYQGIATTGSGWTFTAEVTE